MPDPSDGGSFIRSQTAGSEAAVGAEEEASGDRNSRKTLGSYSTSRGLAAHTSAEEIRKMNVTATATRKTWRTIGKHQLLALIAGGALALGIAGGVTLKVNGGNNEALSRPVSGSVQYRPFESYLTYYVVDSQAQREFVLNLQNEAAKEREGAGLSSLGISYSIIEFRSAQDEASFAGEVNLLTDPTFHVNVVDMRGEELP
jgi:hypothetical protein